MIGVCQRTQRPQRAMVSGFINSRSAGILVRFRAVRRLAAGGRECPRSRDKAGRDVRPEGFRGYRPRPAPRGKCPPAGARASCPLTASERPKRAECPRAGGIPERHCGLAPPPAGKCHSAGHLLISLLSVGSLHRVRFIRPLAAGMLPAACECSQTGARAFCPLTASERPKRAGCPRAGGIPERHCSLAPPPGREMS